MKALVINLAAETPRMEFQRRQLQSMHIPYERLEAVTAQSLPFPAEHIYWQGWQRPLREAEMAAYASHRSAWHAVSIGSEPVLILEDDAMLMPGARAFLEQISGLADVDHVTLECRGRRKLMSKRQHPDVNIRRLWQDRPGAAAYVLWPAGAEKLLARAPGLADAVISSAYNMRSFQADPALAIQIDQCEMHGIEPPIPVSSAILAARRPPMDGLPVLTQAGYRFRRIMAQCRIGIRFASHYWASDNRKVDLART